MSDVGYREAKEAFEKGLQPENFKRYWRYNLTLLAFLITAPIWFPLLKMLEWAAEETK